MSDEPACGSAHTQSVPPSNCPEFPRLPRVVKLGVGRGWNACVVCRMLEQKTMEYYLFTNTTNSFILEDAPTPLIAGPGQQWYSLLLSPSLGWWLTWKHWRLKATRLASFTKFGPRGGIKIVRRRGVAGLGGV